MENNKSYYVRLFKVFVITVCFVLIFVAAIDFSNSAKEQIRQKTDDDLIVSSDHLKESIKNKANDLLSRLEAYSLFIATFDNLHDASINETLKAASKQNQYLNIAIDDLEGNGYSLDGEKYNVSDREYFKNAKKGIPTVSEVIVSKISNIKCIVYAVPIFKDNIVVGVLHATMAPEEIAAQLNIDSLFKNGNVFVLDKNGEIVIGNHSLFENKEVWLTKQENKDLLENKKGTIRKKINGENRDIYYDIEEVSDWYIFTSMDPQVLENDVWFSNRLAFILVVKIAVILLVMTYFLLLWDRKKNREIKKQMEAMHTVLKHSPGGAMCYAIQHEAATLQFVSEGACEIFALEKKQAETELKKGYREYFYPGDYKEEYSIISSISHDEIYYRIVDSNKNIKWVIERREFLMDQGIKYIYVSLLDITNLMNVQNDLSISEAKQRMIIEATSLMYFEYEIAKEEITFSNGWVQFSGADSKVNTKEGFQELQERNKSVTFSKDVLKEYTERNGCNFEEEQFLSLANKEKRWIRVKGTIILDNDQNPTHVIGLFEDINKIKEAHRRLEEKSLIDPLTGIYNKASAVSMIEQKMNANTMFLQQVLFVIDVDDFKNVNDSFGHLEGDEVLSQLGFKLLNSFRKNDIVGRIGGDEFIALMSDVSIDADDIIEAKAKQLMRAIDEVTGSEGNVKITCSIGIACYPSDGDDYEDLFKKADSALYNVKNDGKSSYHFYQDIKK